ADRENHRDREPPTAQRLRRRQYRFHRSSSTPRGALRLAAKYSCVGLMVFFAGYRGGYALAREITVQRRGHFAISPCSQAIVLSPWQARHAFGLSSCPKRAVMAASGMSSISCDRA